MGVVAAAEPDRFDEAGSTETDVLKAVVEPRRRAILRLVATSELSAGEIARSFDVSRPAISQHLTVLKDAGLLTERRDGTRRLYRTRAEGLAGLRGFLDELWGTALADAARIAEAEPEATAMPDAVAAPGERRREAR
ncbi:ArsR/SmtB family transcription factor [Humibacter sp.]|uniref:ArsR/SmtB family transcription factor n=1 Tax=Humibacter sp. TaxID=1940291 RepID=UPI003F81E9AD